MITDWSQVELVCGIERTAEILNRSVRDIERDLANDCMEPKPMPVVGRARQKRRRQWSKAALQAWLEGGYLAFVQEARRQQTKGKRRHFFGKAKAQVMRAS